jgi:hypothetical protein
MNRTSLAWVPFPILITLVLVIGLACAGGGGDNEAPQGSTVEILVDDIDFTLPFDFLTTETIEFCVENPDDRGENNIDVEVFLSFGGPIDDPILVDVNDDGILDEVHILQLIRPGFENLKELSAEELEEALVDSPFLVRTGDHGCAQIAVLLTGNVSVEGQLTASLGNGSIDEVDITVDGGVPPTPTPTASPTPTVSPFPTPSPSPFPSPSPSPSPTP